MYADLLERALRHPDTRSVALTGSYGSGKSSVLNALRRHWWNRRVITKLSLSTLDPKLEPAVPAENPAEREASNRIQKELVKQLLYQLPPRRTPRSRFQRASSPSWRTGALVAVVAAVGAGLGWVVTTLAGWQATIAKRLDDADWTAPWFWGGVTAGLVILALAAWWTLVGRYTLQAGLKAGPLVVRLEPTSSSYFDQYLDEIMYFFQVSKTNVVLIEDMDRFGDAVVFDTLRALNTLVNSSGQVRRRVVFVYAIRDSVLGQIGQEKKGVGKPGGAAFAPERPTIDMGLASRAKFFDVIIPIVPFVTADNARDLMMGVMKPHVADAASKGGVSPALIRLAARHVADMRTLWSIRNEFEVHVDRLMTSAPYVMPGINEDIILSLVLLRVTSPDAYETIRLNTGPLGDLAKRWIKLVEENLAAQTTKLTEFRTQLENGASLATRAERAGETLNELRPELLKMSTKFVAARLVGDQSCTKGDQLESGGIAGDPRRTMQDDLSPLERLAEGLEYIRGELGGLVQEQHPPVCPGDGPRPGQVTAAPHDRGRRRRVVGRLERGPPQEAGTGVEGAGDGVDGGGRDGLVLGEVGEDSREPCGEHGLAGSRRPDHEEVVATRGGHLERPPGLVLTANVGKVGNGRLGARPGYQRDRVDGWGSGLFVPVSAREFGEAPNPDDLGPRHEPRLLDVGERHDDPLGPRRDRGGDRGKHPPDRAHPPVEAEFAQVNGPRRLPRLDQARRREHRDGDGDVGNRAGLRDRRWG